MDEFHKAWLKTGGMFFEYQPVNPRMNSSQRHLHPWLSQLQHANSGGNGGTISTVDHHVVLKYKKAKLQDYQKRKVHV